MEPDSSGPEERPNPGDLYRHRRTGAAVVVLAMKEEDYSVVSVRLGRQNHDTPMEINWGSFLEKYERLGANILTEKERHAFGIEGE